MRNLASRSLLLLVLALQLGILLVSSSSCTSSLNCFDCTNFDPSCSWCSTHEVTSTEYGRCLNTSSAEEACAAPLLPTTLPSECLVPQSCSRTLLCDECILIASAAGQGSGKACGWSQGNGCQPLPDADHADFSAVVSTCPPTPWLLSSSSQHGLHFLYVLIGVVLGLALWFACFRSRHEWTHKLRGIPCSAGMVSEYFEWHGLQDDGFGGKGALDVGQQQRKRKAKRRGATGDDGLRLVLSSDGGDDLEDRSRSRSLQQQQQQADEVEPESIPDWARDNTWCPKLRCPPAPFQLSMLADTLLFVFFSLALFLDRWFTTSRLSGSEMESEIIWGNIQLQYGGASGIAGPERRGYDCTQEGVEVLAFMRAGQCAAIKASGILLYVCGLLYFLLAVVKIYTGFYASLRNVALVAYRHRITRGSGQRRKAGCCGCHARLIRSYLQLRYLRFYLGWAVLFPMAVWRLLTIRDAFSLISPTMLHASFILLLFCLLLDIFALVGEARALERILEKQDKEKEEKRRRGAYVEEDEEDGNGERNRDSSSYVRPPPQRRMQQDPDEYVREQQRLYGDADSSGPYSQQEDEHDHWTTSDLERERRQRAKMAAAQPQQGDDDGEEKKGQAPVLPQHAPIYSSYAAPSTMLLSSSSTSPPSTSVPSAAGTEMSILGQRPPSPSLHSASSSQSHHLTAARRRSPNSSTVSSSRQPSQGTRHALENHTSWRPEEELDEPFDL